MISKPFQYYLNHMRSLIRKSIHRRQDSFDPYITQDKYESLKAKLEQLIKHDRPTIAKEVAELSTDGDFSENAGYQAMKAKLRSINGRITKIDSILKHSQIIPKTNNNSTIQIGSLVTVEVNGKQKTFRILGAGETNPDDGIISHKSPVGVAMMDKKIGDKAIVKLKNKTVEYKITEIN